MRTFEQLEPRAMLSADWRSLPVSIEPTAMAAPADTAAYSLVGAPQERAQYGLTGSGYSVAVIDTGIDYHNPAFAGRYLGGWDFVNNDNDALDDNGHGTAVAGIVASGDANYPGVAPGVGIIALKVLDASGTGSFGNVNAALQWVASHAAQDHIAAVNMSLGAGNYQSLPYTFLDADLTKLATEGVFVAAAAGNDYFAAGSQRGLAFPAVDPLVVSVGATWAADYGSVAWADGAKDHSTTPDQIASFSQRDANLDLLAPGAYVTAPYLGNLFAAWAGTSMATPMATGAAVLVRQALDEAGKPDSVTDVLQVLQSTGVSVTDAQQTPAQDNVTHTGLTFPRVDVLAAVGSVLQSPNMQYVTTLYADILGREPDASGLAYWAKRLDAGAPRAAVVDAIWNSTEHLSNEVKADYRQILGREADTAGVTYWVGLMQAGTTNAEIQRAFYESDEYYAKHGG